MKKTSSFRYLTREGFKNIWANRLMSIASVGVLVACMAIIGVAILLTANLNTAMSSLEKENVVMAYLEDKNSVLFPIDGSDIVDEDKVKDEDYLVHNEEEAKAVCAEIEKLEFVEKVEFITAEQALNDYKENFVDGDAKYLMYLEGDENPLSMCAKVTLTSLENHIQAREAIAKVKGVDTVVSADDVAEKIVSIKNAIEIAGFWIIAILMIIALVIVCNTIRVTMYNRKLEISIMKAVGATDWFIRWPFLIEGIIIGIASALISVVFTYGIYSFAGEKIKDALEATSLVPFRQQFVTILLVFIALGVFAGVVGSLIILNKYLKKEGSEFRAL